MADDKDSNDDILGIKTSGNSSKIDIFGVKLDLFQAVVGILAGGAALGTGYLLYNDMQKKTTIEQAKKQQDQARELQYLQYLREQEAYRRNQLIQKPPSPVQPALPPEEEEGEGGEEQAAKLDMNYYKPSKSADNGPQRPSYNEILNQSEQSNPHNPYAYNMSSPLTDYNATFPSRNAPPPPPPQQSVGNSPMIDMSRMISNPDMEVSNPMVTSPRPQSSNQRQPLSRQNTQIAEQENQQANQDEIDDLYKSMNNY